MGVMVKHQKKLYFLLAVRSCAHSFSAFVVRIHLNNKRIMTIAEILTTKPKKLCTEINVLGVFMFKSSSN